MLVAVAAGGSFAGVRVEVPAQGFDAGGWGLDSQFMDVMGSPYLIAHGLGVRVADATAKVRLPSAGTYRVWVRTRNWADGAPGRFKVAVGGVTLAKTFGADRREWAWEDGGTVAVRLPDVMVALRDLTGFDGRCAGVVFATPDAPAPEGPIRVDAKPVSETVNADFIVVGGGLPGTCAAVAAARRGLKVVLVQDRPVLGGNASGEIRVWCAGEARYPLVRELRGLFMNRDVNTPLVDGRRMRLVADETNLVVRLSTRAFGVEKNADGTIAAVKALDLGSNRIVRFTAPLFCDATGDGWVGFWAGADWRMGREAKAEHGESMAPNTADGDTLGASILWTSAAANAPVPFSAPWAEPHAQGESAVNGEWNWEYGIHRDMIAEAEEIRDRMLLAIYGAFSNAKKDPKNAHLMLNFCPYLLGKRESRRLLGDWIYSETDVSGHRQFEDAVASGSWSIDLHYDTAKPGVDFLSVCKQPHFGRYWIPYRSIYSRNVGNLFVVGRCFSCTHVGLGGPRVINTLSQLGVAAGEAAVLCRRYGVLPRGVFSDGHCRELQRILGGDFPGNPDPTTKDWQIVDDETPGVTFGKGWVRGDNPNGEQVGHVSHFPGYDNYYVDLAKDNDFGDVVYPLPVGKAGCYKLIGRVPYMWYAKPGSQTVLELVSGGKSQTHVIDQGLETGVWRMIGKFELEPGAQLKILARQSFGTVVADGFALVPMGE